MDKKKELQRQRAHEYYYRRGRALAIIRRKKKRLTLKSGNAYNGGNQIRRKSNGRTSKSKSS